MSFIWTDKRNHEVRQCTKKTSVDKKAPVVVQAYKSLKAIILIGSIMKIM